MIKRKNLTMFLEVKQTTPVSELKKMIQGILKVSERFPIISFKMLASEE